MTKPKNINYLILTDHKGSMIVQISAMFKTIDRIKTYALIRVERKLITQAVPIPFKRKKKDDLRSSST